jgi:SPP1 family predicted phage head-tail adaptor
MPAQAYALNKRILIQAPAAGEDAYGQPLEGWVDVFTEGDHKIYAAINPLSVRELFAAQAAQSEATTKITVRYYAPFADPVEVAKMRAVYGDRIFNIAGSVNRNEGGRWVDLLCTEGLNNG